MHLDYDGGNILRETVRWSRFLAIVGIIVLSICILALALASGAVLSAFSRFTPGIESIESAAGALLIAAFLAILALLAFAVFMLYRFSVLTRKGIQLQDQSVFAEGMKCLKLHFLAMGIIAVLNLLSNLFSLTKLF